MPSPVPCMRGQQGIATCRTDDASVVTIDAICSGSVGTSPIPKSRADAR